MDGSNSLVAVTTKEQMKIGNFTEVFETTTRDIFMEQVETYMSFKIATYITKYWFPILVPIGLIGNTLSFLVMIKPNNRKMSTCIYMAAISINDNLMMFLALHNWLVTVVKIHEWHPMECRFAAFLVLHALQNTTFQVLAMTIDKFVAIKWPHKAAIYSTPRQAKMTVVAIYICVVIYNIPHIFISKLTGDVCLGYAIGGIITKVYSWFTFILNAIIPFVLLIYMNYVIVQKVRRSRKMFAGNEIIEVGQGQGPMDVASRRQNKMKNIESQLTTMLLLVTTLFLILMIPTYIRFLYTTFVNRDTPVKYANLMFFYHLSHKLYHTNNGINFFLYCISGQKFRNDLKELFFCGRGSDISVVTSKERQYSSATDISSVN